MKKLAVFCFPFPLFFLPHIFHLSFVRALFYFYFEAKIKIYIYVFIRSFCMQSCSKQSEVIVWVEWRIPFVRMTTQISNEKSMIFFTTQYFFLFTIHWKTSQLNRFPFFPFVLKWHAEKFLVGWLWNIVIGGFARKRVSVCGFLFYSKRHSINVENPIPNSNFIEIIDLKKLFQIDSSLRFWE